MKRRRGISLAERLGAALVPWRRAALKYALAGGVRAMNAVSAAMAGLSPAARYRLADACAVPFMRFWLPRRPAVAQNFAVVLGRTAVDRRARLLARRSVRNYARMAVDFLAVRAMEPQALRAWVQIEGEQYLQEAWARGRGVILVLAHFGSWDVAAAVARAHSWPLTIVTEGDWAATLVAGSRGGSLTLAPRTGSLRPLFRALARNECVTILGDMVPPGVPAVAVPFFGRPARFPVGPARLAQRARAPVLVVSCRRLPDNSYRLTGQPLLYADPALPAEAAATQLTAQIAAAFQRAVAGQPDQWYPFKPVWPASTL